MKNLFHKGHTQAREKYTTKANADYWLETLDTSRLNQEMIKFIENSTYFFFATASPNGQPNLNYKGGDKGFLHEVITKKERNFAIVEDGYKQVEIAEFLNISSSAISKIISDKSGNS